MAQGRSRTRRRLWGALACLALAACGGDTLWARQSLSEANEDATDVAHDATGAAVVTGTYFNGADLGGGPLPVVVGAGDDNFFVAKFGPDGAHLWSRGFRSPRPYPFPGGGGTPPPQLAVSPLGAISVTLRLPVPTDVGGTLAPAGPVLLRYGPDGALAWARALHPEIDYSWGDHQWMHLASDQQGQTLLVTQASPLDPPERRVNRGYVAAYSLEGSRLWERSYPGDYRLDGAAADGFDRWLVSGRREAPEGNTVLVTQLSNGGEPRWAHHLALGALRVSSTRITTTGNRVLVGMSVRNDTPLPLTFTFAGTSFAFHAYEGSWGEALPRAKRGLLLAFDTAGVPQWVRQVGSEIVDVSARGTRVVAAGLYEDGNDLGSGPLPATYPSSYVAAYAVADGSPQWANAITEPRIAYLTAVDHTRTGELTAVGNFRAEPLILGSVVLTPNGADRDAFFWRLAP